MTSTLKKITTKAKQLYKTGKFAKWTDAIKEASKSLHKKPAKKKIGYSKERLNIVKKATPYIKNYKSKGYTKQESIKNGNLDAAYMGTTKKKVIKKATKKATPKSLHKDTMSHNVKISVMSGISKDIENKLKEAIRFSGIYKSNIEFAKLMQKKEPQKRMYWKLKVKDYEKNLKVVKQIVSKLKKAH
jgi:hypothetical protein